MSPLQAVILGIVQGVTEFLPVSSSGHLAVFHNIFGYHPEDGFPLLFDIVLHLGTLVSVIFVLRKDLWMIISKPFSRLTASLLIATIPIIPAGIFLSGRMDWFRTSMPFLMGAFLFTALILFYADAVRPTHLTKEMKDINAADALTIGVFQAVAILPGVSRSGATMTGSLFRKLKREDAAKFIFLLSIPAIIGATALEGRGLLTGYIVLEAEQWMLLGFGFLAALLSGYLAINLVFVLIKKARLKYFSFYLLALVAFIGIDTFILKGLILGS
ncbi:MAG: undecaprenyl-diphosphate phosphatase [Defluviitaleaceae bacterium]|nr:undecaprenyl-diphosphate phosphatase [Defluviitaleaceae bacterium]